MIMERTELRGTKAEVEGEGEGVEGEGAEGARAVCCTVARVSCLTDVKSQKLLRLRGCDRSAATCVEQ